MDINFIYYNKNTKALSLVTRNRALDDQSHNILQLHLFKSTDEKFRIKI